MQSDFLTIAVAIISSCVCITGFIGVVIINIVGAKKRMIESERLLKAVEKFTQDNKEPLPFQTRFLVGIYLFISLVAMGSIVLLITAVLSYNAGLPFTSNIDAETLGVVSGVGLAVAILATLAIRILFGKIFKSR